MAKLERARRWPVGAAWALLLLPAGCIAAGSPHSPGPGSSSGESPSSTNTGSPEAPHSDSPAPGAVCSGCSLAGGETSDFGGTMQTPCEASEVRSASNEAEARALGFGAALDAFVAPFSAPLAWTRGTDSKSPAPSGYAAQSMLTMTTRLTSVARLHPSLAGCDERLDITFDASFATADGALSITGSLRAKLAPAFPQRASARLDLSQATGTLRVSPLVGAGPTQGLFAMELFVWPDRRRGSISIFLLEVDPAHPGSLQYLRSHDTPLEAAFPPDDCGVLQQSLDPSTPSPLLAGKSPNQIGAELATLIASLSPAQAKWSDGRTTAVTMRLGAPSAVCVSERFLSYQIPFGIRTQDARVNIERPASTMTQLGADGGIDRVAVELYEWDPVPRQDLAGTAGISGVTLDMWDRVIWHAYLDWHWDDSQPPRGEIAVEGVDGIGAILDGGVKMEWKLGK